MNHYFLQTLSFCTVFLGLIITAFGTLGYHYFTKKIQDQRVFHSDIPQIHSSASQPSVFINVIMGIYEAKVYGTLYGYDGNILGTKGKEVLMETVTMTQPQKANTTYVYTVNDLEYIFGLKEPWQSTARLRLRCNKPGMTVLTARRDSGLTWQFQP